MDSWTLWLANTKAAVIPYAELLIPLAVLIVGWIAALIASGLIRRLLAKTNLDNRLIAVLVGEEAESRIEAERWISRGVFYLVMLFVLVGFFRSTGLTSLTGPLNDVLNQILGFLPSLLSAVLLLILAWIIASGVRLAVRRVLKTARVDERLRETAGVPEAGQMSIPENGGNAVYWLVFLIFPPAVLESLSLRGLLQPVQDMMGNVIGFVPNIFASGLILLVGWFIARIVQRITSNLLATTGIDGAGERVGFRTAEGAQPLSSLLGTIVYTLILILTAISALDALQFKAISGPATRMLSLVLNAVPSVFLAMIILLVAHFAGRFVATLVSNLLSSAGFDGLIDRLGLSGVSEGRTASQIVGHLAHLGTMLFAAIEAADALSLGEVATILARLTEFAGQVVLGVGILGVGLFLANLVAGVLRDRGPQGGVLSLAARVGIIVLTSAMALEQMGIASEIINTAFGLVLGAIAVAAALAFGLGARDIAAREVETWLTRFRGQDQ